MSESGLAALIDVAREALREVRGGERVKCAPTTGKVEPEGGPIDDKDVTAILRDLGDTLRHIRVAQRIQMIDLADMANLSPSALSRIERGVRADNGIRQLYAITGLLVFG
jgi:hypothetical protein